MTYRYFIGADISKPFIDMVVLDHNGKRKSHLKPSNDADSLGSMIRDIDKELGLSNCLFCMENTGIYNEHLLCQLHAHGASIWLEKAVQIKLSLGLQRGKNDKIDAFRPEFDFKTRLIGLFVRFRT